MSTKKFARTNQEPSDLRSYCLVKKTDSGFTKEQAVRVYLFNKAGYDVPGISKTDLKELQMGKTTRKELPFQLQHRLDLLIHLGDLH